VFFVGPLQEIVEFNSWSHKGPPKSYISELCPNAPLCSAAWDHDHCPEDSVPGPDHPLVKNLTPNLILP